MSGYDDDNDDPVREFSKYGVYDVSALIGSRAIHLTLDLDCMGSLIPELCVSMLRELLQLTCMTRFHTLRV